MIDPYTFKLTKHNGIWAMRELRAGRAVCRISWQPGEYLSPRGVSVCLFLNYQCMGAWELLTSALHAKDWVNADALAIWRSETSRPHVKC